MNNSDETLEPPTQPDLNQVLEAINSFKKEVNDRFDRLEKDVNAQFETIRQGIVHNSVAFDRLQATVYSVRANLVELTEEVRQSKKDLALK